MRLVRVVAVAVATTATVLSPIEAGNLRGSAVIPRPNCAAPESIYQGSVKYSSTTPGSTATYLCMKGTNMKGSSTVRCNKQGLWTPERPQCRVTYLPSNDNTYKNHDTGYALYSE
jgi:hypothetical protein